MGLHQKVLLPPSPIRGKQHGPCCSSTPLGTPWLPLPFRAWAWLPFRELLWSVPRNSTHCCRHCKARGPRRLDKGEALRVGIGLSILGSWESAQECTGLYLNENRGHDEQLATICTVPYTTSYSKSNKVCITYSTWLFPSSQNTNSTTANHMCFLLPGVKQTLIRPGAWKELELKPS